VESSTETQFKFRGILQEEKPLRDWTQEVLMNCLGYYSLERFNKWCSLPRIFQRPTSEEAEAASFYSGYGMAEAMPLRSTLKVEPL
jgi:hypothetical protein